jgi:RNA polymerase-binding transcription factor DksA
MPTKSKPRKKSPARKAKPSRHKNVKPSSKKSAKPTTAAKPAPKSPAKATKPVKAAPKSPAKPAKKSAPAKPVAPTKAAPPAKVPASSPKPEVSARASLRNSILAKSRTKTASPIAFSLDEVRAIAKVAAKAAPTPSPAKPGAKAAATTKAMESLKLSRPAQPNHVKAASLADILGFNPKKVATPTLDNIDAIPEKFRRYYRLLLELRAHLTGQIDQHSEDTLKRSSKDDAGDLSSYGQHMADAGTDTFDRDFALSMVANEQEALSEVEAAVQRIKAGTYGICESTGKPIAKERLIAVPFTRYSAEALKQIEKNRHRARTQAGLFGELGEEGGSKMSDDDGGGDE